MVSNIESSINTKNEFNQALSQQSGSAMDKDSFMLLLVTQFQNQDPLNPMEDKEFISQLAQFSSLEQMMNMSEGIDNMVSVTQGQELINSTSYIGKNVDATGTSISKITDLDSNETSVTSFRYAIGETAASVQMNIYDSSGNFISQYNLPSQSAGTHTFDWDGFTADGLQAPDGVYKIVPSFTNSQGASIINYDAVVDGLVTGTLTENGVTYLILDDGRTMPLSSVRRVSDNSLSSSDDESVDTDSEEDGEEGSDEKVEDESEESDNE